LLDNTEEKDEDVERLAVMRALKGAFKRYMTIVGRASREMIENVTLEESPVKLFQAIVYNVNISFTDAQKILETDRIIYKLSMLYGFLVKELNVLEVEVEIHSKVHDNLNDFQREHYLREQMKVISEQLGDEDGIGDEMTVDEYTDEIYNLNLDPKYEKKLLTEAERLRKMPAFAQEAFIIKNYLDTCLALPWNKSSKPQLDFVKAEKALDKDQYGMKKVKQRILETIAVHMLKPELPSHILCLVGPPGVGKTSIGKSVAKALGRKYARISLGGVRDEADIRGHRRTYLGAMHGRIIDAYKTTGVNNPLILFDEIDKMCGDYRGDPSSAMLEVFDSEQNKEFHDHFIDMPFDLSKTFFITTANTTSTIEQPLLDRMEVIEIPSYTREEKFQIAKGYLLPKQIKKNGLKAAQIKLDDEVIYQLIDRYTREAGVRSLERNIGSLCRKAAKEIVAGKVKKQAFTMKNLVEFLGTERYKPEFYQGNPEVGVVNGLAWTACGGTVMPLEVLTMKGKGGIEITGSLGDVMRESAMLAVSYTRSNCKKFKIDGDFYKKQDLHIHAPEGAIPKDGPSAGVTIATSMISALSGIPVKSEVAMTGEITLHGKVLPIGGLREKTMAAYKAGITTVIIPEENRADLREVDDVIKSAITFVYAENLDDVLAVALDTGSTQKGSESHAASCTTDNTKSGASGGAEP
jgi:ATP-dependent Lon protease